MAVYMAMLKPGDTILGMNLAHGGHLTHGHPLNFSGKYFNIVPYGVRKDDERLDYDELERLAREHRPKTDRRRRERLSAADRLRTDPRGGHETGSLVMTDMAHIAGLVAAGEHPSPVPHSDFVTTTTHKTLRGPARRHGALPRAVREGPRPGAVPGRAGRAADAHHRGQGRVLQGSARAGVPRLPAADRQECRAAGRRARGCRIPARERRHRQPPDARRCLLAGAHRQGRGSRARTRRHHREQERDPVRPESADGRERHPRRHAGGHDARHARSRRWTPSRPHRSRTRVARR